MEIRQSTTLIALMLPIFIMYVLIIIRYIDSRFKQNENTPNYYRPSTLLSVRDFILATIVLDIAELVNAMRYFLLKEPYQFGMIAFLLFFLHFTFYILFSSSNYNPDRFREIPYRSSRILFTFYLGFFMLFTNAYTIKEIFNRFINF